MANEIVLMDNIPTTPVAITNWSYVRRVSKFDENHYSIDLVIDPEAPEWKNWLGLVLKFENEQRKASGKKPVTTPKVLKEKEGVYFLKAKRKVEKGPPPIATSVKGETYPDGREIPQGSKVRAILGVGYYSGLGGGTTLYLNALQVIEEGEGFKGSGGGILSRFEYTEEAPFETEDASSDDDGDEEEFIPDFD